MAINLTHSRALWRGGAGRSMSDRCWSTIGTSGRLRGGAVQSKRGPPLLKRGRYSFILIIYEKLSYILLSGQ